MNKTGSLELIKKLNRSLVLETIRNEQPISRAAVAKKLGLSRSTVTLMVNDLLEKKFVVELGLGSSIGGRRGIELGFNPKSGYGIGVDIGRTKIIVVLTDLDGEIIYKERYPATNQLVEIVHIIHNSIIKAKIDSNLILGIGFGLPGIVNSMTGEIIDCQTLNWEPFNFVERISPYFSFPIFINNDVNLAALGERWLGGKEKISDMFYLSIGTGVGSAIISNGSLIEGYRNSAGEINHYIDRKDVEENRVHLSDVNGVFEQQISRSALSKLGFEPDELFSVYKKGNKEIDQVVASIILHLSTVISNIVCLLNPQKVIVGGGFTTSLGNVIEEISKNVADFVPIPTEIELACLGSDSVSLGAVAYVFEKLQDSDVF